MLYGSPTGQVGNGIPAVSRHGAHYLERQDDWLRGKRHVDSEDDTYSNECGGSRIEGVLGLCHTPAEL